MILEIHAVNSRDQRGRQEDERGHGEDLDDRVLLVVDHAQGRIEQETHFVERNVA